MSQTYNNKPVVMTSSHNVFLLVLCKYPVPVLSLQLHQESPFGEIPDLESLVLTPTHYDVQLFPEPHTTNIVAVPVDRVILPPFIVIVLPQLDLLVIPSTHYHVLVTVEVHPVHCSVMSFQYELDLHLHLLAVPVPLIVLVPQVRVVPYPYLLVQPTTHNQVG